MYKVVSYVQENKNSISKCMQESDYLWLDNLIYTRQAVITVPIAVGDATAIVQRLDKNIEDIKKIVEPYYPAPDVNIFVDLLKQHVNAAALFLQGDQNDSSDLQIQWNELGNQFVNQLDSMNYQYWSKSRMAPLWLRHIDLAIEQTINRRNQQWEKDIESFDEQIKIISEFSYRFAKGLIYQNLDRFSEPV